MEHDLVIGEIQNRYADIQRDGGTVIDAIADVLEPLGFAVVNEQCFNALLAKGMKYVQIRKIVEQEE